MTHLSPLDSELNNSKESQDLPQPTAPHLSRLRLVGSFTLQLLLGGLFIFYYLQSCSQQSHHINLSMGGYDQTAYMQEAIRWKESGYTEPLVRNRMPLYLFIISLLHREEMETHEFFQTVKTFNIYLSLVMLLLIWRLFRKHFSFALCVNLITALGFLLFAYKAPYVQCEILHFSLFLFLFVAMYEQLGHPTIKRGFLIGFLAALSYMTKASMLLMMCSFVLSSFFAGKQLLDTKRRVLQSSFISLFVFLVLISPYLHHNLKAYGSLFYNDSTSYVMWSESWTEALDNFSHYREGHSGGNLPEDIATGPRSYLRIHGIHHMLLREWQGLKKMTNLFLHSSYGFQYVLSFLAFIALFTSFATSLRKIFSHLPWPKIIFSTLVLVIYSLAIAWYLQIDDGLRFLAPLYPITLFLLAKIINEWQNSIKNHSFAFYQFSNLSLMVLLTVLNFTLAFQTVTKGSLSLLGAR